MSKPAPRAIHRPDLRVRAEAQLGVAEDPASQAVANASAALGALHALASSPATAADALALLHELQVHQVELALQAEELSNSRHELEAALRRMIALYDATPMSCCTLDARATLHEINQPAAAWLGDARELLLGHSLCDWLTPACGDMLRNALAGVLAGEGEATLTLQLRRPLHNDTVTGQARVRADPSGPFGLMAWMA